MIDVDQAPIRGIGLFDPGAGMFGAAAFLGDGDNGEILGPSGCPLIAATRASQSDSLTRTPRS